MRKVWLIARTTYGQRIRSSTFLLLTFGIPLLMIVAGAIPLIRGGGELPERVGYVDQSGALSAVTAVTVEDETLAFVAYDAPEAAGEAFRTGEVVGYLVIPAGYAGGETPKFYGEEEPGFLLQDALTRFMRQALLPEASDAALERLSNPTRRTYVARESGERVSEGIGLIVRFATPAVLAMMFALTVLTGASQMGAAVVQEKDQRAMEMVITSLRPWELVSGKLLGMTLVSMTQVAIWAVGAGVALGLAVSGTVDVGGLSVPWRALVWGALLCVPGYFLYATVAAGLGIIAGDQQQARQLAGLLGMVGMAPLYLMGALVNAIDGPLAVGLTLFPLTAPTFALFRMVLTEVPTWQLLVSFGLIAASLVGSIWFVARIFRAAMLMYGQRMRPKQIWQALRQA
jgi:ABC-2 type transport system permease protein